MIGGRLRNGSIHRNVERRKDDNVNYLIWSENESRNSHGVDRRRSSGYNKNSDNRRHSRSADARSSYDVERKIGFFWGSADKEASELKEPKQGLQMNKSESGIVDFHLLLNVGGRHFRVRCSTIQYRCPSSFLAQFSRQSHTERVENCDGYLPDTREYFFERSGKVFEPVYDFLTTGHFHRPGDICRERLFRELDFWKIKKDFFAPCCMPLDDDSEDESPKENYSVEYDDEFNGICCGRSRRQLWTLMEDPSSSSLAKAFAILSITMVIASVSGMILGSLPELQSSSINISTLGESTDLDFKPHLLLDYMELVCIIWFTFEYVVRLIVCTDKWKFAKEPLNLIDSLTIIPFYLEVVLHLAGTLISGDVSLGANTIGDFRGLAMIMRVVRVMRVARVFKLARYSSGLKSFGMTVKTSLPELSMLTLFLLTAIIFFSTLMYFAERDEPGTRFRSIPHAGWWCIVTMTTVGYGDFCPQTFFGKIIASCASISGVLVLAFPITMIVENFSRTYDTEKNDFKTVQRRRRMAKAYA